MDDIEALYIAYTIIWLGLFGYMVYVNLKMKKLSDELKLLKEMVKKDEGK